MVLYKKPLQGQQFRQRWHDIAHSQHGNGYRGHGTHVHHHCSPSCLGPQNRCLGLWHPWSVWKIYWPAPHSQNKQTKTWRGLHPGTQQVKHHLSPCLKHPHGWPDLWWRVPTGCRWSCQVPTAEIWHQHCGTWQRQGRHFLELSAVLNTHHLEQLQLEPTRGEAIFDLYCTNWTGCEMHHYNHWHIRPSHDSVWL